MTEPAANLTELELRAELFDAMDGNLRMSKRKKLLDAYREAVLASVSVPPADQTTDRAAALAPVLRDSLSRYRLFSYWDPTEHDRLRESLAAHLLADLTQHAEPADRAAEVEPEDTCRLVDIDGETIRVHGAAELSEEGREALGALIGVAKRKYAAEHPPVEVADPERRERYAEALYGTLEVSPTRHPWATLGPLRRAVWYARADAAMALADEELRRLAVDAQQQPDTETAEPAEVDVDTLARLMCDADVYVNDGDYPGWDDLSKTPGLGQDEVRKAARYLMARLHITERTPAAGTRQDGATS